MSCRKQRRGIERLDAGELLREAMDDRAQFSRHQGFALRHGARRRAHPAEPTRRDRLLLINAFAMLLTMLGAPPTKSLGMDRLLKSNTSKTRTHSLFRQGCMLYELIPTMPEHRLSPLMARFAETISQCRSFSGLFAVV